MEVNVVRFHGYRPVVGFLILFACSALAAIALKNSIDINTKQEKSTAAITRKLENLAIQTSRLTKITSIQLSSQTSNHTKNVGIWCSAINQGRNYDRTFVHRITQGRIFYGLPDLNCKSLEDKTRASGKIKVKPHAGR